MIGLLCSGQGAQYVGMGRELVERSARARSWFARAGEVLGWDLARLCFDGPEAELLRTVRCQPAIYAVSVAAWEALCEAAPAVQEGAAMAAGLSLGEYSALAVAGAFAFEDGLRLVQRRGELMEAACAQTRGAMLSVLGVDEPALAPLCAAAGVEIANLNSPEQIVVSGERGAIERLSATLRESGIRAMALNVAGAYHSRLMSSVQEPLRAALAQVPMRPPRWPVLSNATAQPVREPAAARRLLAEQVVAPVRWEESMRAMLAAGVQRFVELGPGRVLSGLLRRIDRSAEVVRVEDGETLTAAAEVLGGGGGGAAR